MHIIRIDLAGSTHTIAVVTWMSRFAKLTWVTATIKKVVGTKLLVATTWSWTSMHMRKVSCTITMVIETTITKLSLTMITCHVMTTMLVWFNDISSTHWTSLVPISILDIGFQKKFLRESLHHLEYYPYRIFFCNDITVHVAFQYRQSNETLIFLGASMRVYVQASNTTKMPLQHFGHPAFKKFFGIKMSTYQ